MARKGRWEAVVVMRLPVESWEWLAREWKCFSREEAWRGRE